MEAVIDELCQRRWVETTAPWHREDHLLAAFAGEEVIGFLRFVVQPVGPQSGREPVTIRGAEMLEAKIYTYGVLPAWRRRGASVLLQREAITLAMSHGCHQIRLHGRGGEDAYANLKAALASAGIQARRGVDRDGVYVVLPSPVH